MSGGQESVGRRATLRAMAHPVRLRILSLLTGAPLTAADVARELGLTHANASYHLRSLHAAGLIVQQGEEKIRGGVAKRYRYDAGRARASELRSSDPHAPEQRSSDPGGGDLRSRDPGETDLRSSDPGGGDLRSSDPGGDELRSFDLRAAAEQRALFAAVANELVRRTAEGDWSVGATMSDAELWIDPEEWRAIRDRIGQVARDLHDAARPPHSPGAIRTSTTIAMFRMEST